MNAFLVKSLQITQISVFNFNEVCSVAGVISVVRKYWVDGLVFEPECLV